MNELRNVPEARFERVEEVSKLIVNGTVPWRGQGRKIL